MSVITQRKELDMRTTLLVAALAVLGSIARADAPRLAGRVVDEQGAPLGGARVLLYTAAVRVGTSPMCPSCWADCAKSATTSADGAFHIDALDPQLVFRVLVVAEGFKPTFVEKVDPAAGPVRATLARFPADLDPQKVIRGKVSDAHGKPVVGATVSPIGAKVGGRRWYGQVNGVDSVAVTNAAGEFMIVCDTAGTALDLEVEARGLASARVPLLGAGETPHALTLGDGATVNGRLVRDGKPLAGVEVGLVSADRGMEQFAGPYRVGTDAEGRFSFTNVMPDRAYVLYGAMSAMAGHGAVEVKTVSVAGHGSTADAGVLGVGPSHRVAGRVVLSDGKPLPAGTRVMLSRDSAWDSQIAEAGPDGRFAFEGVPPELVNLGVTVRGYHVSEANASLDRLNGLSLMGLVDGDVTDLTVQLDPGPVKRADMNGEDRQRVFDSYKKARGSRIAGVAGPT
jgi:hypothetical protein